MQGTPLVSIVIPNKDEKDTLKACLESIKEKTTYPSYEIVIVENNSQTSEIFEYYKEIDGKDGIRVVTWKEPFNYSKINNFGFQYAKGDYVICLNNDITVITPSWIEEMLGYCQRPGTGIVGVRLYFPDDTIQHAGIIVGMGGCAGSLFVGMNRKRTGYMHKAALVQDLSAVTAACMMVKREAFEAAGGFEESLAVAFNDVDFCLKVRRAGYLVVYNPYAELYHYESKTRGLEDSPEKQRRFQSEIEYMRCHWLDILKRGDPYYNRNFHFQPHFKPDFNVDLLRSNNYITHFFVVRTSLIRQVGGFRREYDGAQDYDFIFRCTEAAKKICHIPEVLYHWRTHQASTADNPASKMYAFEAGKRAIEAHLKRQGVEGTVSHTKDLGFYQVEYPVQGTPLVSVLIPNKDQKDTLKQCLDSVFSKTTYCNYEVIIIENNSQEKETWEYYEELKKRNNVKIVIWESGFNYSAINNFGEKSASGEYLLFLNNDVEVINPHWMEEMLGNCQRKEVGIVGAKLYYPDDTIQHAGTIIGIGGIAGHAFLNMPRSRSGYLHKASLQMDLSAVTAACMMMKRTVFESLDGFEEALTVAFNDVDLCLRCVRAGYLVVYNPRVELYHYESKSRGSEDSEDKVRRFQQEIEFMRTRWIDLLKQGDPYYNKNLTLSKWNYSLRA